MVSAWHHSTVGPAESVSLDTAMLWLVLGVWNIESFSEPG